MPQKLNSSFRLLEWSILVTMIEAANTAAEISQFTKFPLYTLRGLVQGSEKRGVKRKRERRVDLLRLNSN